MSLDSGKTLGGIGAILIAVGSFVPFLGLVGMILVLVAMKRLSEYYNERGIFNNALYGFILGIISIVVTVVQLVWVIARVFVAIQQAGYYWDFSPTTVFEEVLGVMALAVVIISIFSLLQAIFYRKSLTILSDMSGEKRFVTAGLLLLIGTIVSVVITGLVWLFVIFEGIEAFFPFSPIGWIGGILPLVAWILAAVGFFSIKTPTPQLPSATPTVSVEKKFCRYCGAENKGDAVFCGRCGKKIGMPAQPPPAPSSQLIPKGRFCTQCGKLISVEAKFCPYCGKNLQRKKTT